jgi:predicted small secreted protein
MTRKNTRAMLINLTALMLAAVFTIAGGGCHTIEGVGEDMSAAGQTVADWASKDDDGN